MAFFIEINKLEENSEMALYAFCTYLGNTGKVSINKKTGECFIIEEPESDKESILAIRMGIKLSQHWKKGKLPEKTCWAS